ncbi:D-glycero-alpha-D-manno-heptose 7-phosphate kinase [subsurface metagenome]
MIICRTPYRLSFFGGATDYPAWYNENPGAVLATSIDKYCYLLCRWLPPFFEHKHRLVWSQIEKPQEVSEIRHPSIRETLKYMGISQGIEIQHAGDLPARTGMGTSSSFTVGLLHALYALKGIKPDKMQLALEAIHIEQDMIGENVGSQDQVMSAFGGFNRIQFDNNGITIAHVMQPDITTSPPIRKPVRSKRLKELEGCLMLFFTGFSRIASKIAAEQIERVKDNTPILKSLYEMVGEGEKILTSNSDLSQFGKLLDEGWKLKRRLSDKVSTDYIDFLYNAALDAGAIGGKVCGAGGGGFLLLFVPPELQEAVRKRLKSLLEVPFQFETSGSTVIFYEP